MIGRPRIADKVEHFWSKVEPEPNTGCWFWTAGRTEDGYGKFTVRGERTWVASRFAWEATNGPIQDGLWVLHRCDNPPCCNPRHLFLGDVVANRRDCRDKGRLNAQPGIRAALTARGVAA